MLFGAGLAGAAGYVSQRARQRVMQFIVRV